MPVIIPIQNQLKAQQLEVVLDEVVYKLNFTYNARFDFWTMAIRNLQAVDLISGIKLVLNYPLSGQFQTDATPPGEFICIDTTDKDLDVNGENFGNTVQLLYFTEAEIDGL